MIPKIDAGHLLDAKHAEHARAVSDIRVGATEVGFFTIYNTPFSQTYMQSVFNAYKGFFSLPNDVKSQWDMSKTGSNRGWGRPGSEQVDPSSNPDYKQVFDCGYAWQGSSLPAYAPNLWPDQPADFRRVLEGYYESALSFALELLCAVASAVGEDPAYFRDKFDKPMALLRGNYYPPRPEEAGPRDFGIASHTDYGCLTLLATDGVPGLEVRTREGGWIPVSSEPGEFVINFGEMLEMWTQQRIIATPHRVVGGSEERLSVPLFFNPRFDTNVAPRSSGRQVLAVDHLQDRFNETYVHLHKR